MGLSDVYRVQVQEVWANGRAPDPETYWLDREETITLLDALCQTNSTRSPQEQRIGMITVTPFWEVLTNHERPLWDDEEDYQ